MDDLTQKLFEACCLLVRSYSENTGNNMFQGVNFDLLDEAHGTASEAITLARAKGVVPPDFMLEETRELTDDDFVFVRKDDAT